jgi:hypothetical protein
MSFDRWTQVSKPFRQHFRNYQEAGYTLPLALLFLAVGILIIGSNLLSIRTASRAPHTSPRGASSDIKVETAMNRAGAWLRSHSKNLVAGFSKEHFYSTFSRGEFSNGTNDGHFPVATKIKLPNTTYSVLLTSDSWLGVSNFPNTRGANGGIFYPAMEFAAIDFGTILVKVTLVDAVPVDESQDFGPPPNSASGTDFNPVFRIDAFTKGDSGSHVYGYFVGSLQSSVPLGFYGSESVVLDRDCDSYNAREGAYRQHAKKPNCPLSSSGAVCLRTGKRVFGSVSTTGVFDGAASCGGSACSDVSCAMEQSRCEGPHCTATKMPEFDAWEEYCPEDSEAAAYAIGRGESRELRMPNNMPNCWSSVTVAPTGKVVLTSTRQPYFIRTLSLGQLEIRPDSKDGTVQLYVQNIVGGTIEGSEIVNLAARPSQFVLNYLSESTLKLHTDVELSMSVFSPNARVEIAGGRDFFGAVAAKSLLAEGDGELHFDESPSIDSLHDVQFRLVQTSQLTR